MILNQSFNNLLSWPSLDLSADINGPTIPLESNALGSMSIVWTGAGAAGTFKVQVSDDGTHWNNLTDSDLAVAGAGNNNWDLSSYFITKYARLIWVHTGGSSGTLTVSTVTLRSLNE